MDANVVDALLELLGPLHEALNEQTYDERFADDFRSRSDRKFAVYVTAQQERDLHRAFLILEGQQRAGREKKEVEPI